jgi:predicted ABC-type ATPase
MAAPRLIFAAGPNGAGKCTFYETFLRASGLPLVNAHRIAAALGVSNLEAAQVADAARVQFLADGESFVTETVFSDPVGAKLQFLRDAIAADYSVTMYYVGISSAQLSEARISQRVSAGGHDVPPELRFRHRSRIWHRLLNSFPKCMFSTTAPRSCPIGWCSARVMERQYSRRSRFPPGSHRSRECKSGLSADRSQRLDVLHTRPPGRKQPEAASSVLESRKTLTV